MRTGAGTHRKPRRRPEQAIQRNIVDTLRMILPRDSFLFAVPNGGARSGLEASIFQGQGVIAGVPDLMLCWAGRAFGLEVKADNGTMSPRQHATHDVMRRAGVPVAVVRGLPEAIAFLREQQVPLRIKESARG
jgi:hypothetical protein